MTHAVPPSSSPRVQRPWQDWLLSLLLHLVVLTQAQQLPLLLANMLGSAKLLFNQN